MRYKLIKYLIYCIYTNWINFDERKELEDFYINKRRKRVTRRFNKK